MPAPTCPSRRRAFTLIEMIIVTVMIAILATMTTVRMSNLLPRRAQVTVRQVQNLLDALAHRSVLAQAPIAIVYEDRSQRLWIERFTTDEEFNTSGSSEESRHWVRDVLAPVVQFDKFITLHGAYFEGQQASSDFRRQFVPGQNRPLIEIDIAWSQTVETLALLPGEQHTIRRSSEDHLRPRPEDLDEDGKGDEQW